MKLHEDETLRRVNNALSEYPTTVLSQKGVPTMTMICPKCASRDIETRDVAKKTGGALGLLAGAASGVASAMSGADIGASVGSAVGLIAGPVGSRLGGLAGTLIGGLLGGVAGGVAGARLGHLIDEQMLDNYHCLACDYRFSLKTAEAPLLQPTTLS